MAKRRISYLIPSPGLTEVIPRLQFPPSEQVKLGRTGPTLLPHSIQPQRLHGREHHQGDNHSEPRHRLAISSLALDTSTILSGTDVPQGILYSTGRDGMLISYDLGLPMVRRPPNRKESGRWEHITGWADLDEDEFSGQQDWGADGDVLGDVTAKQSSSHTAQIPGREWEIDPTGLKSGHPTRFRQSAQMHTDWINDIALCNYNQTVVSGSSDGTVKSWNPHVSSSSTSASSMSLVGTHKDYVRCLAYCPTQTWLASGSFDHTIKLWDLSRSTSVTVSPKAAEPQPVVTLNPASDLSTSLSNPTPPLNNSQSSGKAAKSSIYALTADPYGRVIASGGPERVVRLWDPRSGKKISKLVGHTDNIRSILISDDARYLLTASADASIKLWSLSSSLSNPSSSTSSSFGSPKCLHTFTHHTDSVWSLFSSHPSLEVFYSGDRMGMVCRVDVTSGASGSGSEWAGTTGIGDLGDGECTLLTHEQDTESQEQGSVQGGINKIIAQDDRLLWTATGSSSLKRWKIPPRRSDRASWNTGRTISDNHASRSYDATLPNSRPTSSPRPLPAPPGPQGPQLHRNSAASASATSSAVSIHSEISSAPQQGDNLDAEDGSANSPSGIPYASLIRLISANDPFSSYSYPYGAGFTASASESAAAIGQGSRARGDAEVVTLYSAASVMSVPRTNAVTNAPTMASLRQQPASAVSANTTLQPSPRTQFHLRELASLATPLLSASSADFIIPGDKGLVRSLILNDRMHALTVDTTGEVGVWDIVRSVCKGVWTREDVLNAAGVGQSGEHLQDSPLSPRDALEVVRERVEGEGITPAWATTDTKTGLLAIHLTERCFESEVYADDVGYVNAGDEAKIIPGRWILRNLFYQFMREEYRSRKTRQPNFPDDASISSSRTSSPRDSPTSERRVHHRSSHSNTKRQNSGSSFMYALTGVVSSPSMLPALPPEITLAPTPRSSPLVPAMIPLYALQQSLNADTLPPPLPLPQVSSNDATPMPPLRTGSLAIETPVPISSTHSQGSQVKDDYFSTKPKSGAAASTPGDDFSSFGSPKVETPATATTPAPPTTPGGGLMGRLKTLGLGVGGKMNLKRGNADATASTTGASAASTTVDVIRSAEDVPTPVPILTPRQILLSTPALTPPPSSDAPTVPLPPAVAIMISEESEAGAGWTTMYRGIPASTAADLKVLEEEAPLWLLEYLFLNKLPPAPVQPKMGFVLMPYPEEDMLPELLNTAQSKLTASKFLRVRKLVIHVQDKLDGMVVNGGNAVPGAPSVLSDKLPTPTASPASPTAPLPRSPRIKAEELYEILCNDVLLPLDMTIAAVRQYVWKQPAELVMHYRRKSVPISPA